MIENNNTYWVYAFNTVCLLKKKIFVKKFQYVIKKELLFYSSNINMLT